MLNGFFTVAKAQIEKFSSMEDSYFKERASDIKDITKRVLNILLGNDISSFNHSKVIIVAKEITPSQMAAFDSESVLGVVSEIGGETSHSAMIARSREIPAVYGVGSLGQNLKEGDTIILDGKEGAIHINPTSDKINQYKKYKSNY
ncbi:MAG: PEP-utilizing enzyme [Bacteriovoracaceae bacterium]